MKLLILALRPFAFFARFACVLLSLLPPMTMSVPRYLPEDLKSMGQNLPLVLALISSLKLLEDVRQALFLLITKPWALAPSMNWLAAPTALMAVAVLHLPWTTISMSSIHVARSATGCCCCIWMCSKRPYKCILVNVTAHVQPAMMLLCMGIVGSERQTPALVDAWMTLAALWTLRAMTMMVAGKSRSMQAVTRWLSLTESKNFARSNRKTATLRSMHFAMSIFRALHKATCRQ